MMKKWILAAVVAGAAGAWAEGKEVGFVGMEGTWETRECSGLGNLSTEWNGWLAAEGRVAIPGRIQVYGNTHLILCDGATLLATNGGIRVAKGASLMVWGQREGSGRLVAWGTNSCAGIGGNDRETGGRVAVYGGKVEAKGGEYGAGIGGGDTGDGGTVEVHGGEVWAEGNDGSAGIGGGDYGNGGSFRITGGKVTALGGARTSGGKATGQAAAGIGAGRPEIDRTAGSVVEEGHRSSGTVSILGGEVTAKAGVPPGEVQNMEYYHPYLAQAIGVNVQDAESNGTNWLALGAVAVYTSAEVSEPVPEGERGAACRGTAVWTRPCEHGGPGLTCAWCGRGAGTEEDPYLIGSYAALVAFAEKVNGGQETACGVLTADIAAEGTGWVPIGVNGAYRGTFDGGGHTIRGLSNEGVAEVPTSAGMFSFIISKGTVRNVRLEGVFFKGVNDAGGVAGGNIGGAVSNCCVSGSVSGGNYAGGIVGVNQNEGTVANCWASGRVSGKAAGGVVGMNQEKGMVTNCHGVCEVEGSLHSGGVVGLLQINGTVANSYGLAGVGVVGYSVSSGTVSECGELDAAQFLDAENFKGWDFGTVWKMGPVGPYLRMFGEPVVYPLWVGGTQVWEGNAGNILRDGTARFARTAAGGTLVLSNAVITNAVAYQSGWSYTAGIYAGEGFELAVTLAGSNRVENVQPYGDGIHAVGNLSLCGAGSLTVESGENGIYSDRTLLIEGVTVAVPSSSIGLRSHGNIVFSNATVSATGEDYGIFLLVNGSVAFAGESRVEATATKSGGKAVMAYNGITMEKGLSVALPVGGGVSLSEDMWTIADSEGNPAAHALVARLYDITVTGGSSTNQVAAAGFSIEVTADDPEDGKAFVQWSSNVDGLAFEDAGASPTRFTMPATNVAVEAVFKPIVITWRDEPAEHCYTGGGIEPDFDVALEGVDLILGTNYTVSWASNVNVGTAMVTVTLTNRPTGVQSHTFFITPRELEDWMVALTVPDAGWWTFSGEALQPGFSLLDGNPGALTTNDLAVAWTNNMWPGTATAIFTGTNNYRGRVEKTFEIKWASCTVDGTEWSYRSDLGGGTHATVTGASPAEGALAVPGTLDGLPVAGIGDGAFAGCTDLKSLRIPDGAGSVGKGAFEGSGLERLSVPWAWMGTEVLDGAGVPEGCVVVYRAPSYEEWARPYEEAVGAPLAPEADSDGDGALNREEYVAGTDPTDGTSVFRMGIVEREDGVVPVVLPGAGGEWRDVRMYGASNMPAGPGEGSGWTEFERLPESPRDVGGMRFFHATVELREE